jgi:hypothetical protein
MLLISTKNGSTTENTETPEPEELVSETSVARLFIT